MGSKNLSYKDSGVDIEKASQFIEEIKAIVKRTHRSGVVDNFGSFGAFFEIPKEYKNPLLVSGTDGVGTKLKIAQDINYHETIGIDLVAMCVNDIVCHAAEPLFFLDYYATGKIDMEQSMQILRGVGKGCELSNAALIGGETAEMPGLYNGKDYDLAGFCVGVVEREKAIDGKNVQSGDSIIALASSGPHSNGYSLIRKVIDVSGASYQDSIGSTSLGEAVINPTRIYVRSVLELNKKLDIHGIANITGGGLIENIPRCIPGGKQAVLEKRTWEYPEIFQWLQEKGNILDSEMHKTFNVGVGMVIIVSKKDTEKALEVLKSTGETAWLIGSIKDYSDGRSSTVKVV